MDILQIIADLNRAGYEIRIVPEFSVFGVVEATLLLKRVPNPLYPPLEGEASGPWAEAPIMGSAVVWDPESYARVLREFHRIAFPA